MDEDKKRTDIALFRYALIAPVIQQNVTAQAEYFRGILGKSYDVPHIGTKRFKFGTLKLWLKQYRRHGFDALKPKTREDKGDSRKIKGDLASAIQEAVKQYPVTSCAAIHRMLIAEGHIGIGTVAEGTVRKYIRENDLKHKNPPQPRKKFEHEHVNDLWIGDCLHGPYISNGRKKQKVYLLAAIDDHSRMVVGSRFFFHENSISLELVLKEAILQFGLPKAFYCDNGSLFVSSHLQLACARLGIALIHSRPYDSPSRGNGKSGIMESWRSYSSSTLYYPFINFPLYSHYFPRLFSQFISPALFCHLGSLSDTTLLLHFSKAFLFISPSILA